MTTRGILDGLYAVSSSAWTADELKQALDWLRAEYRQLGLDPRRIRRDVLDQAARDNTLTAWTYADLLGLHYSRHLLLRRNADMGAANDDDAYKLPYERAANSILSEADYEAMRRRPKLTEADLPKVTWSAFRPITRARCLTRDQLVEMTNARHGARQLS